ncbi:hypothetical protein LMG24238_03063 [Paraburkholderia sediminicola]|uniref:Uncharacterized protein n=1 Tax=Paraburkholderia sediminicola TaxID=458836 RepID=A0A6J5B4F3_9BURK|nr:hypothetical protein LMG24238_03063 [Paraburkholderia sediminicola]
MTMTWLIIFLGIWPLALGALFAFAVRVDPRSGRWRRRHLERPCAYVIASPVCFYCLQRTTIDRFLTFAPKIPPTEPPEVAPLSTSFETTS